MEDHANHGTGSGEGWGDSSAAKIWYSLAENWSLGPKLPILSESQYLHLRLRGIQGLLLVFSGTHTCPHTYTYTHSPQACAYMHMHMYMWAYTWIKED